MITITTKAAEKFKELILKQKSSGETMFRIEFGGVG